MPRWIQHPITHELIPAEEYVRPSSGGHYIQNDIEPFISPVDGTVVSSRREMKEHNKRNNVVPAQEYDQGHYDAHAKKRAKALTEGPSTREMQGAVADAFRKHGA